MFQSRGDKYDGSLPTNKKSLFVDYRVSLSMTETASGETAAIAATRARCRSWHLALAWRWSRV